MITYWVLPYRFLFILLGPKGKAKSYHEIGRAIATLMSDEVRKNNVFMPGFISLYLQYVNVNLGPYSCAITDLLFRYDTLKKSLTNQHYLITSL